MTFVGTTREDNAAASVLRLEYEAYEPMALIEMRKLVREAGERWEIVRIAIQHRIGFVAIGETSVAIAVSAAASRGSLRGVPFRDRSAEGNRADLEEGAFRRRRSVDWLPDVASAARDIHG